MSIVILQIPIIIAQVGYELPKTNQEMRMTTAAGTVIQLMGSDEQYDLPVFPVVLAYNRINHYAPTHYLCDTSLSDWRFAQMYRHLVCANDFYVESLEGMNDPLLDNLVDELNVQMEKVKLCIEQRAKRGLFAASSVPISMTGPNPKRNDPTARFAKVPQKSSDNCPFFKLPQPEYTMLPNCEVDTVCVPDLYDEDQPASQPSSFTSAGGGIPPSLPPPVSQQSSQPEKRKAGKVADKKVSKLARREDTVDDDDKDPNYDPSKEATAEEEEDQPLLQPLSQQESVSSGIPIGHKMRRGGTKFKDPKRYPLKCPLCPERYQRTNDLTDHHYVDHLHKTYDCAECMKQYNSHKSLKLHFKLKHQNIGRVKCSEPQCEWTDQDPGKLHNHLLKQHDIGEPIVCKLENSDGKICNKIFINTRSFQEHKVVHSERNYECEVCNRKFPSPEHRAKHIKKYYPTPGEELMFQCEICGKTFTLNSQLENHKTLHKLHHHKMLQKEKKAAEEASQASQSQGSEPVAGTSQVAEFEPEVSFTFASPTAVDLEKAMEEDDDD